MKKVILLLLALIPALSFSVGASLELDKAPDYKDDIAAMQNGAKMFVNYCQSCHGLSMLRYNRLEALGLTPDQVRSNLIFSNQKIGDTMKTAMVRSDGKKWLGVAPPDLSLVARARSSSDGTGADWLYTYLRSFYIDPERSTGWNNVIFPNVSMPHILWELQGTQRLVANQDGSHSLVLDEPGLMTPEEFDQTIGHLVGFLVYAAEPAAKDRKLIGIFVLIVLSILFVLVYALKKNYWKDVH